VRVISGRLGGRRIDSPGSDLTHPMSEKMCGALFNTLGDIEGLTVLDAFAGSGALSFEAVSRGAASAMAIESNYLASQTIARNIETLGLTDEIKLVHGTNGAWAKANPKTRFDLVLCDPPYDSLQETAIAELVSHIKPDGLLVLSWPSDQSVPKLAGLTLLKKRTYGSAQLIFYRA
jgi:16S rRNA (guanine966-N2)-methyltransferase